MNSPRPHQDNNEDPPARGLLTKVSESFLIEFACVKKKQNCAHYHKKMISHHTVAYNNMLAKKYVIC